jgi:hypothetical protein
MWFPHIAIDFVFVLDMVILYFLAIGFLNILGQKFKKIKIFNYFRLIKTPSL